MRKQAIHNTHRPLGPICFLFVILICAGYRLNCFIRLLIIADMFKHSVTFKGGSTA